MNVSGVTPSQNSARSSSTPNARGADSASARARAFVVSTTIMAWKFRSLCSATAFVLAAMSRKVCSSEFHASDFCNNSACSCAAAAARDACVCAAVATSVAAADARVHNALKSITAPDSAEGEVMRNFRCSL